MSSALLIQTESFADSSGTTPSILSTPSSSISVTASSPSDTMRVPAVRRTAHACERCQVLRVKCTGGAECERCLQDAVNCGYKDRKRERNKQMQHTLEELVHENDFLRQQRGDILANLKMISCDPKLGTVPMSRIAELIRKHEAVPLNIAVRPLSRATLPVSRETPNDRKKRSRRSRELPSIQGRTSRLLADASDVSNLVKLEPHHDSETSLSPPDTSFRFHHGPPGDMPMRFHESSIGGDGTFDRLLSAQTEQTAWMSGGTQEDLMEQDVITQTVRLDPSFPWYDFQPTVYLRETCHG